MSNAMRTVTSLSPSDNTQVAKNFLGNLIKLHLNYETFVKTSQAKLMLLFAPVRNKIMSS